VAIGGKLVKAQKRGGRGGHLLGELKIKGLTTKTKKEGEKRRGRK